VSARSRSRSWRAKMSSGSAVPVAAMGAVHTAVVMSSTQSSSRARDLEKAIAACDFDNATADTVMSWMVREGYDDPSEWADLDAHVESLVLTELRKETKISFAALSKVQRAMKGELKKKVEDDGLPPPISGSIWVVGIVASLLAFAGPTALGILTWNEKGDQDFPVELWYYAWGPMILLCVLEIGVASLLAPRIGWDMIQEASEEADLREAMKNSMSTQGLIAALFLSVVWAMLQAEPIQSDASLVIAQWYEGLLALAVALTLIGTVASIICLLYIEPLNPSAAQRLVFDNFMYFGEPLALSLFGFFNAITATILFIFGNYGLGSGIVAVFASVYCMCRLLVIYQYFSAWENKEISHLRAARKEIKSKIANTGGVDQLGSSKSLDKSLSA